VKVVNENDMEVVVVNVEKSVYEVLVVDVVVMEVRVPVRRMISK
jgi:hypothetical protein